MRKEQPELRVTEVPTSELLPYANNAKIHTREQVEQIARSIEEFGFNDPIAVWHNADGDMEIVEGHGRVMAAKKLGLDVLPIVTLDHLTDEQRRAYTHIHNQLTMNTDFDWDMLVQEVEELGRESLEGYGIFVEVEEPDLFAPSIEEESPEVDFGERIDEENNYIVLKFTNEVDWIQAQQLFELKQCKRLSTRKDGYLTKGMTSLGIGRVIDGAEAINRLLEV